MQSSLFKPETPQEAHARRLRALANAGRKNSPASQALRDHAARLENPRFADVKKTPGDS